MRILLITGIIDNSTLSKTIGVSINNIAKPKPSVSVIFPTITSLPSTGQFWEQFNLPNLISTFSEKIEELNNKASSYFIILYEHGYCYCSCLVLIPIFLYFFILLKRPKENARKIRKGINTP